MNIKNVGVIGAGTMGSGIASVIAMAGYNVFVVDVMQSFLDRAKSVVEKNISKSFEKGIISENQHKAALENLIFSTEFEVLENADLVIEAVSEDMDIKKKVIEQLNQYLSDEAIVASNTSALKISDLALFYKKPERVLGMHFFNPAVLMKLVELIKTDMTSVEVFELTKKFVIDIKKEPVEVKESWGFVVNRALIPMINEAACIYEEGVSSVEDIDKAMKLGANHPIGPLALADLIGIDICVAIMETLQRGFNSNKYKPASIMLNMIKEGKLGKKSGEGFYKY